MPLASDPTDTDRTVLELFAAAAADDGILPRTAGTGAGRVGSGGREPGLSWPAFVETVGRDVVLPVMECAAATAAKLGRAGIGGGIFRLAGIGGASLPGADCVFVNGRETA